MPYSKREKRKANKKLNKLIKKAGLVVKEVELYEMSLSAVLIYACVWGCGFAIKYPVFN